MSIRINRGLNGNQIPKNVSNWLLDCFGHIADNNTLRPFQMTHLEHFGYSPNAQQPSLGLGIKNTPNN